MPHGELMQIGEVAERTGLSLRTIRHYEDVGLVVPSARSQGGFRLYTDSDVQRLLTVKRMKPLDFTLEEIRDLLDTLDKLNDQVADPREHKRLADRLFGYRQAAETRCQTLREQLAAAEEFAETLTRATAQRQATS